jgi:general secretion pathway protein I
MKRICPQCAGFTLIEVMVALLIVAVALPALMFQLGTQLDSAGDLEARTVAGWVAQEELALRQLQASLGQVGGAGYTQGESEMANRNWLWQLTLEQTPVPGLVRHTIDVASASEPSVTLSSFTVYLAPSGIIESASGVESE